MLNNLEENKSQSTSIILGVFLFLTVLTDFHYKYSLRYNLELPSELVYLKLVIGLTLLLLSLRMFKFKSHKTAYVTVGGLVLCSLFGLMISNKINWFSIIYIQGQYFFGLLVFFFFVNYYKYLKVKYLIKLLEILLWSNLIFILVGYFFEILLFKTYGGRFGYDGIFKSTSVASYFYMFSLVLFLNQKKSKYNYLLLFNIIISSLLVGSKTLYAFLIVVFLYFIANKGVRLIKNKKLFWASFIGFVSVMSILLLEPLFSLNRVLKRVLEDHGVLTAIFSYRDVLVKNAMIQVKEKFTIMNYLFGGLDHIQKLSQVALVDLFISFGFVGSSLILYFIIVNFPRTQNKNINFMLFSILIFVLLRGNFLYYPSEIFISMTIFAVLLKTNESNINQFIK